MEHAMLLKILLFQITWTFQILDNEKINSYISTWKSAYSVYIRIGETGACWDSMGVIKQCQDLHFRAGRQD